MLYFGHAFEELRALEFLREIAGPGPFPQLSRLRAEIVFVELEPAFVKPAWLVTHRLEVDRTLCAHRQLGTE